jgi:phosphoenolpyruvate-protein kinase (PTS system EI component)
MRTQLRALLRASSAGSLAVMLPMVSSLTEVEASAALLEEARAEVGGEVELGIMVEIPAAALLADELARSVRFFSVGSNDLVQYALAVDRTNPRVSTFYQPLHPAVLRLLDATVKGAHAAGGWAGVCGEMAGDIQAIPLLLGLGFDELSMTPSRIPAAKEQILSLELPVCQELARQALLADSSEAVETLVREQVGG